MACEGGIPVTETIKPAIGPITKNIDDLTYLYKLYLSQEMYDIARRLPSFPYKEPPTESYTFGVISNLEEIMGV